ncbi:TetR/AcrR family transcriptional regulator [Saccharopolyspora gloriosae]|uniref:AcrR family transcriptional regulator n=1 Tax=Saccharopolyspora gloriosae TaxID=455344 RepID=A0A840NBZ9_9PSEU|nr:TetR/AcrR family transcriptional regulator [Saccharopolyspora gloriosae]MBB5069816.1 AcrR family transcriptional regulator [Saccharopolyspora gloriosae]
MTRGRGRPGHDVDSLLRVAAVVFHERGYDGTSMEELAKRLGITKSAIYHHVSGKQELLRRTVDRALDALLAVTAEPESREGPAIDRLRHVVRRSVHVLVEEQPFVTVLLRVRGNSEVERAALVRRREIDAFLGALVAEAERDGSLRSDLDPALTSRLLFGTINSIIEWYRPQPGLDAAALADAVTKLTFEGLEGCPGERP